MKFIDYAKIKVKSGKGGSGCVSFRREKYVPKGGPSGGTGGCGGDVYIVGDASKSTLLDFQYKSEFRAEKGEHGGGKDKDGARGNSVYIKVPLGTIVKDADTGEIIADIKVDGQSVLVAKGGRGGRGNKSFASSVNRAPFLAEEGEEGSERLLILELKLIADVGIVGFPNAGKSTFLSVITNANPKIDSYPFTTIDPNLGVYNSDSGNRIIFADMPGLIEGAHKGIGLGIKFLKHISRTKLLLHFIDSSVDKSMIERYEALRKELLEYSSDFNNKKEIVVSTKMDQVNRHNLKDFENYLFDNYNNISYFKISTYNYYGIEKLLNYIEDILWK
ncbi:MAG: GTPase ObgE [Deferribacterota bacterium]|nr:GTPase ObgE [Deferribacterota bacterium]